MLGRFEELIYLISYQSFMLTRPASKRLDLLSGIARGIVADKVINKKELSFFKRWVLQNAPRKKAWPWSALVEMAKKKPTKGNAYLRHKAELAELLRKIVGTKKLNIKTGLFSTHLLFNKRQPRILFKNQRFVLTGVFKVGPRSLVAKSIKGKGGLVLKKLLLKNTDYLVVGTFSSPSWPSSHLGRKIEQVAALKSKGKAIKVISEHHLLKKLGRPE